VSEYSHRDLRAQREADRAFWTVVALCVGWTVFAVAVPLPFAGFLAVSALVALGAGYLVWSERMLAGYSDDLGRGVAGTGGSGFLRAEGAAGARGPDGIDRRSTPSPHRRRRGSSPEEGSRLPTGPDGQAPP
jgi:hypothetical protein